MRGGLSRRFLKGRRDLSLDSGSLLERSGSGLGLTQRDCAKRRLFKGLLSYKVDLDSP